MNYPIEISHIISLNALSSFTIFISIYFICLKIYLYFYSCFLEEKVFVKTKQDNKIYKCVHFTCVMSNPKTFLYAPNKTKGCK